jgi:hypothetical protein
MAERADVIARVRKLRERAAADPGREGRTAGDLARKLIREHKLTAAELYAPPRAPEPARRPPMSPARRRPVIPVALDLNIAGIRIRWDGKL